MLQYLYSLKDQVLHLGGKNLCLHAYSNADFAGNSDDRCSTGGYAIFIGARAVSWSSRKQSVVTLSSTESGRVLVDVSFPFVRSDYVISTGVGFRVASGVVASS